MSARTPLGPIGTTSPWRHVTLLTTDVPEMPELRAGLASQAVNVGARGGALEFSGKASRNEGETRAPLARMGGTSH